MTGEPVTTLSGNLVNDPELRFLDSGVAVASFTIASTPRSYKDGQWVDGDTLFMRCSVWRQLAEHASESLRKGHRIIATGTMKQRSYETKEGEQRSVIEMDVQDVGPSLMFVTSDIHRADTTPKQKKGANREYENTDLPF